MKTFILSTIVLLGLLINTNVKASSDYYLDLAISEVRNFHGKNVSVTNKYKSLKKFGRNDNITTIEEMVWNQGGFEVLPTGNTIDSISSNNLTDSQIVVIEGHTLVSDELVFSIQSVTLDGQTPVTLTTPLYRATRLYNNDSTDFAGSVYVYESGGTVLIGVPQTADDIHLMTSGSNNQSLKAATSLSGKDYWFINSWVVSVDRQNNRAVDFKLQVREQGKVFRTVMSLTAHSQGGAVQLLFKTPLIIKPNSDIRVTAISSGSATGVSSTIEGVLGVVGGS